MIHMGVRNQGETTMFVPYSTAAADGGTEGYSATIEAADFDIYKNGGVTQRSSTAGFTVSEAFDGATGLHGFNPDLSDDTDAGFYSAGDEFQISHTPDETVDAQTIEAWLAVFQIENNPLKAVRLLRESFYPSDSVISTVTSNDTTHINLTDVVDAQTPDAALVGRIFGARDATDGRAEVVVSTAVASKVATVRRLGDGTAMSFTVAAGDNVWEIGYSDLAHVPDANVTKAAGQTVSATATVDLDDIAAILADTNELQTDDVPGLIAALNDLSAAEVNAEVDTALADYDAPTKAELDSGLAALNDPTAAAIVAALFAEAVEGTTTFQESMALQNAAAAGKASGMGTTSATLRNLADTIDRIAATVDADGNRTAVTTTFTDL